MRLAASAASSCPESAATIPRSHGDPSGEEMRLMGKGWLTHRRLLGKALLIQSLRLWLATVTLRGKKHTLILFALDLGL